MEFGEDHEGNQNSEHQMGLRFDAKINGQGQTGKSQRINRTTR